MFKSISSLLFLALLPSLAVAQDAGATKVGYTGELSSLDGGLEGTVSVVSAMELEIMDYVLADASAPALYWWGSTDDNLSGGFRISNTQVTETSDGSDLMVELDAGKTTADFAYVGLWCERLAANFGQTMLVASSGASASSTGEAAAATSASDSGTMVSAGYHQGTLVSLVGLLGVSLWMA